MTSDQGRVRLLNLATGVGVAITVAWSAAAVWMAGRGFSGANEGGYLLYYRQWSTNPRAISAAQYFYGPLFELLHWNVVALRLVRLGTLLLVHAYFGWTFATWLLRGRPATRPTRRAVVAVTCLVVAAGGIVYGWLPSTPGYNDVALLGALLLLANLLLEVVRAEQGRRPHPGLAIASGAVASIVLLAKPSTVVCVAAILGASLVVHRRGRARGLVIQVLLLAGGAVAVLGAIHLFVKPLDVILPPMLDALDVVATYSHSPSYLVGLYAKQTAQVIGLGVLAFVVPGLLLLIGVRRLSAGSNRAVRVAAAAAVAVNCTLVALAGGLLGGLTHAGAYTSAVVAMLVLALVSGGPLLRDRSDWLVIGLLVVVPVLQAAGTGNPLWVVAVNGAACWTAVGLWVVAGTSDAARSALAVGAVGGGLLVTTAVGISGVLHSPHGAALYLSSAEAVPGVPLLDGLRLPRAEADEVIDRRQKLSRYIDPPGRPMIAYGELSHEVLFLNGLPIGQAWFSNAEDGLQSSDLEAVCRHGNPWGDRQPLILTIRPLTATELSAWHACGLDVNRDYTTVLTDQGRAKFSVLVPRGEVE